MGVSRKSLRQLYFDCRQSDIRLTPSYICLSASDIFAYAKDEFRIQLFII